LSFRSSFEGDEPKKVVNFLRKKVHPIQNPGYAYEYSSNALCIRGIA